MEHFDLVHRALEFATKKHSGQKRKYTGEDYIVHPVEVLEILYQHMGDAVTPEMAAAALLHDTVEDTNTTRGEIYVEFGNIVFTYVHFLTDISVKEDGNRAIRKELDLLHVSSGPPEVHSIKVADLISNSKSIMMHDPNFAVVYMKEKLRSLNRLTKANQSLRDEGFKIINK